MTFRLVNTSKPVDFEYDSHLPSEYRDAVTTCTDKNEICTDKCTDKNEICTDKCTDKKCERIEIRLPKGGKDLLKIEAAKRGMNLTKMIKKALREYLNKDQ